MKNVIFTHSFAYITMNIAVKKVELIEWLAGLQDKSILNELESLKKKAVAESYESRMKPMSSQQFRSIGDRSEQDYKNGRITSQENLEKESENW
ncbi:MAG: hypothetical protein U5K79_24395 [Cyclobacteriaceae bacterium]|nr:hypothetical protein [Cyclobacteriaceae bacterium]